MANEAYKYLLYDGRAASGDTENASVYTVSDSLKEARNDRDELFPDGVIFKYKDEGDNLTEEEFVE